MKSKLLILSVLIFLVFSHTGVAIEYLTVSAKRGDYLVLDHKNMSPLKLGAKGEIFTQRDRNPVGVCQVIDIQNQTTLCKVVKINNDINYSEIQFASFSNSERIIEPDVKIPLQPKFVSGLQFNPLVCTNSSLFLSVDPLSLAAIPGKGFSAIKNYLHRFESESDLAYLVDIEHIRTYSLNKFFDLRNKQKLLIGTKDGQICMIYEEGGVIKTNILSETTIRQFRSDLYFHIILQKR